VLERQCPDCAFDAASVVPRDIGMAIRDVASQWEVLLLHPGATNRPVENVWSPSEYGCHVRDVFRMYDFRLELMLTEDDPLFPNWDQDETAISDRYDLQDPLVVRRELAIAGDLLAERFDAVTAGEWLRTGMRSDGARFTVDSIGRYFLHDPIHHLWDVSRTY
jgi:hypothetical protein